MSFDGLIREADRPSLGASGKPQGLCNRFHQNQRAVRAVVNSPTPLSTAVTSNEPRGFGYHEMLMTFVLQAWQLMLIILASWIHRQQQEVIEYLHTENAVLKERLGKKRILLIDDQRLRLAVKGKILGRKQLEQFGTLFTPDTILRWHRQLVASKWDYSHRKNKTLGRPGIRQVIVNLTARIAKENPTWGYDRISGALSNLGYKIYDSTIGDILKSHGIETAPDTPAHRVLGNIS